LSAFEYFLDFGDQVADLENRSNLLGERLSCVWINCNVGPLLASLAERPRITAPCFFLASLLASLIMGMAPKKPLFIRFTILSRLLYKCRMPCLLGRASVKFPTVSSHDCVTTERFWLQ
jgi:hypothetical protein